MNTTNFHICFVESYCDKGRIYRVCSIQIWPGFASVLYSYLRKQGHFQCLG